jgi:hypothetical protein
MVDRENRSTNGTPERIPNTPWKERQYEAHIGMPSGRTFPFFLGMYTRLVGLHRNVSSRKALMIVSILSRDIPSAVSDVPPSAMAPLLRYSFP